MPEALEPSPEAQAIHDLQAAPYEAIKGLWAIHLKRDGGKAFLGRYDRFYLLTQLLHRPDADHPWVYARCRDVERTPDGCMDLWAREHYKSTIITFAGTIQEILQDPDITIAIFSHMRPNANKFLLQIKRELENNEELKDTYPDVLYRDPRNESVNWSLTFGITVKRKSNPKEATVEACGMVDGMPTGSHYSLRIYDDMVTKRSVSTPEQVKKTTEAYALSDNLGARGKDGLMREWMIGTRYTYADTYQTVIDSGRLKVRLFPATDNGLRNGNPVFLTPQAWEAKKAAMPSGILAAQMLQNPAAGNEALFRIEWLENKFLSIRPATLTVGIMCDPASSKKKASDDTVMHVWGMDSARNRYLLDGYHHKMDLSERWRNFRDLHKIWSQMPGVQLCKMGYERFGSTADLEYFTEQMEREKYHFEITELSWPRESEDKSKFDRIQRLEPDARNGQLYFALKPSVDNEGRPTLTREQEAMRIAGQGFRVWMPTRRRDHNGKMYTLQVKFFAEYRLYPFSPHDDGLDCASRWMDMDMRPPVIIDERTLEPEVFSDGS